MGASFVRWIFKDVFNRFMEFEGCLYFERWIPIWKDAEDAVFCRISSSYCSKIKGDCEKRVQGRIQGREHVSMMVCKNTVHVLYNITIYSI